MSKTNTRLRIETLNNYKNYFKETVEEFFSDIDFYDESDGDFLKTYKKLYINNTLKDMMDYFDKVGVNIFNKSLSIYRETQEV